MIRRTRFSTAGLAALCLAAALPASAASAPSATRTPTRAQPTAEAAGSSAPADGFATSPEAQAKFEALRKEMGGSSAGASGSAASNPAPEPSDSASLGALFFKMLASLAAVVLLAVLSMRFLQRLRRGPGLKGMGAGGSFLFEVMETCHLGPGQRIVAVRMQDKVGVLGVTKEGISFLTTLDGGAKALEAGMRREGNAAQFGESLAQVLDRFKKPKGPASTAPGAG